MAGTIVIAIVTSVSITMGKNVYKADVPSVQMISAYRWCGSDVTKTQMDSLKKTIEETKVAKVTSITCSE